MSMTPNDMGPPASGPGEWIQEHKSTAIGVGLAGLVGIYLFMKSRSGAAASSSGASSATLGSPSSAPVYLVGSNPNSPSNSSVSTQGPSANALYQQLTQQQNLIDSYLANLSNGSGAGTSPVPTAASGGSSSPVPTAASGGSSSPVGSTSAAFTPVLTPNASVRQYLQTHGAPGESSFVSSAYDPTTAAVYALTNDGGVYTINPQTGGMGSGPFFGSAFSVGAGGPNAFSQGSISVLPSGGYSITNNQGQTYTFN